MNRTRSPLLLLFLALVFKWYSESAPNIFDKKHAAPLQLYLHPVFAAADSGPFDVQSTELPRHSWVAPLSYMNYLSDWILDRATVALKHYVVLVPGIANRYGQMWHREPLLTDSFEIQFAFGVFGRDNEVESAAKGTANGMSIPEGFALWYSYEPYKDVRPKTPEIHKTWNLFGYKNQPKGLGVFFKAFDTQGRLNPSISATYSADGGQKVDAAVHVPFPSGIFFNYRNKEVPMLFKFSAGPMGIIGRVSATSGASWVDVFHLKGVVLRPNGYVGFTAYNGPEPAGNGSAPPKTPSSDMVVLHNLKVTNTNLNLIGEANAEVAAEMQDIAVEDILKSHSVHKDQRDLSNSLKQLTHMIYKHISEQTPREEMVVRTLTSMSGQMMRVASELRDLRAEIAALVEGQRTRGSAVALQTVQHEITGLANLFHTHTQHQTSTLHKLTQKVEETTSPSLDDRKGNEIRELSEQIEKSLAIKRMHGLIFIGALVGLPLVIGAFWWKMFRDFEKRHVL